MRTMDLGNNESKSCGIAPQPDGTFIVLTFSESKTLKTRRGAEKWLAKRGYAPDGSRLQEKKMTDAEVRKAMEDATAACDAAEKLVDAHFMPRLREAIAAGERQKALEIAIAMPECVTKVFAADALRQAGWSMKDWAPNHGK